VWMRWWWMPKAACITRPGCGMARLRHRSDRQVWLKTNRTQ
jgi:hypothetical protein